MEMTANLKLPSSPPEHGAIIWARSQADK